MNDSNENAARSTATLYRFGQFVLDGSAGSLTRNGVRVRLQDQPFQLLALLLEKAGDVVSREEIRQRLWQSNTFVDFDKSLGVAVLKVRDALGDSAATPRFLETVHRRGYRFIAPVVTESLSPTPVVAAIHGPSEALIGAVPMPAAAMPGSTTNQPPRRLIRSLPWLVAAVLLLALVGALVRHRLQSASAPSSAAQHALTTQPKLRRSVAVLGFRNVAGGPDQQWLSAAFTEMLTTELASNGDLRMVSGEDVANVKHDLALPTEITLARATLTRLRSSLDADVVVAGSFTILPEDKQNRIRLDIRAQETALGETIFEDSVTGNENDLFDLVSQAGSRLRENLIPALRLAPGTAPTSSPESYNQLALQLYSEGIARLYEFDYVGARDYLKRAVTADPKFALAHASLSRALNGLGYENESREEAKRAWQHASDLPEETALSIQGQFQESTSDWSNAVLTYRKLFQLFPDNLSYGLRLAAAQLHNDPAACLSTLASLRTLPAPLGTDPRIDLIEASALISHDLPKARAAAQTAIDKASKKGGALMVARGYGILCQMSSSVQVPMEQSVSECTRARDSYLSAGDQNNAARTLNDLAGLYYQHGDLDKAESMWTEAIEVFRKVGDTEGTAASSNNLGDVLLTRGKLGEAQKWLQEALAGYKLTGDRSGQALALVDLGEIALKRGDLAAAGSNDEQAIAIGSQSDDKSSTAYGMVGLGDVLMAQDELDSAHKQYQTALKIRQDLGEKQTTLQTRVALARLAIEEGHADAAEAEARKCVDQFHESQLSDDELAAGLVLADALLHQSKSEDAGKEIAGLRAIEQKTQNRAQQLRFSLESAQVMFATHDLASSQALLRSVAKDAAASEFSGLAWEAQALLAETEVESGNPSGASKELKNVAARERSSGLVLLARKADETAKLSAAPIK